MLKLSSLRQNVSNQSLTTINYIILSRAFSNVVSKLPPKNVALLQQTALNINHQNESFFHSRSLKINFKNFQHYKFKHHSFSTTQKVNMNKEWTSILNKAEKIVGYPTSFLNLRYLVSDEVAHFASLLRKLMLTKHPLIKMARQLIACSDNESRRSLQMNGLIVLLISKAAGVPLRNTSLIENDISDGIHNSQRRLAEIAEMIYMGSLIHKGILDLKEVSSNELKDMDQGNKLAVLCGDYLLASACNNLSKLHNNQVVELMSEVIGDISQGIFSIKSSNFSFLKQWYDFVNSDSSSLLANSAKSVMLLAQHSPKIQEVAWNFAKNLDIAHKIWSDLIDFSKEKSVLINKSENILNAIYNDKYKSVNQSKLQVKSSHGISGSFTETITSYFSTINTGIQCEINEDTMNFVVGDCKLLFNEHYSLALENLDRLENEYSKKEAIESLRDILNLMKSSIS